MEGMLKYLGCFSIRIVHRCVLSRKLKAVFWFDSGRISASCLRCGFDTSLTPTHVPNYLGNSMGGKYVTVVRRFVISYIHC